MGFAARFVARLALILVVALHAPSRAASAAGTVSLHDQIGQLIILGFHGTRVSDPGFRDILIQLETGTIGGVLFLGHNIASRSELLKMTSAVRSCRCQFVPLIAVDQEGGRVQRLAAKFGFERIPSAREMSVAGVDAASRLYYGMAKQTAAAGFNVNFGPVVDLDLNAGNQIIEGLDRSYSKDPTIVYRFAKAFVEGHRKAGVISVLKHFPGEGSSAGDTHKSFVDVSGTWNQELELLPYRLLIAEDLADGIMVGHIANNMWNGIATLAPSDAISRILRRELGYRGVVFSDDLEMGAIQNNNPIMDKAFVRALGAGNDVIIFSNFELMRPAAGDWINAAVEKAVDDGRLEQSVVVVAFQRVRSLKGKLHKASGAN